MIEAVVKRVWEERHLIVLLLPLVIIGGALLFNFGYLIVELVAEKPPEVQNAEATYLKHAQDGDDLAQSLLAWSYLNAGYLRSARHWYTQSAERGDPDSIVTLGDLYIGRYGGTRAHVGELIGTDPERAISLYERVHDLGDPRGAQRLCFVYGRDGYTYKSPHLEEQYCASAKVP